MSYWYTPSQTATPNRAERASERTPTIPDPVLWAQARFHWQPDPIQAEILRTTANRLMLCCTRQWGKSTITAIKALHHVSGGALWLISTPNGQSGFFYNEWHSKASIWQRTQISADQCSRIAPDFLAGQRIAIGDQIYRQEYQ